MDLRKLDALVGTHVMGWQVKWVDVKRRQHYIVPHLRCKWGLGGWSNCPDFSYSIGDAWYAVTRMQELGYEYNVDGPATGTGFVNHRVSFRRPGKRWITMQAKTPQIAICLAALKAHGVDVSEFEKEAAQ